MAIILDTSAWVEFFQDTEKSSAVANILKTEETFTSVITFAEIVNWCFKNKIEHKIQEYIEGIKKGYKILDLNEEITISAGKLNYERRKIVSSWGIVDSIIVATSLIYNLKVLTKDSYFRDLSNVQILI